MVDAEPGGVAHANPWTRKGFGISMSWSPESRSIVRRRLTASLLGASLVAGSLFEASRAQAVGNEETNVMGKGIVGGALVGGEAVMLVEALIGVKPWWAYAIGGGAGAIGGGIGGFFLADAGTGAAPMALLTAGLILTIPTTIAVLSATAYKPDQVPANDTALKRLQVARLSLQHSPSLLAFDDQGGFQLAVPAVSVNEVYSLRQRMTYGLPSETEVRVPMFDIQF